MIQDARRLARSPLGSVALLGALLGGCSLVLPTRVGSGVSASETRALPAFERLALAGRADVVVRHGEEHSVRITCDDNLLAWVETEVEDGELVIGLTGRARYEPRIPLQVEVLTRRLAALSVAGSGRVEADQIDCQDFSISLAGSGEMRLAGRAEELSISIAGSGDLDLRELAVERAEVSITGSGDVALNASERLDISIAGSGQVAYLGSPLVSRSVLGSGQVVSLAP